MVPDIELVRRHLSFPSIEKGSYANGKETPIMGTKVFVGNLSFDTSENALRTHFENAGVQVADVAIIKDRETGRPRGFGFVELATAESAATVISKLDSQPLDGRELRVNEANDRPRRDGGGGGRRN